MSRKVRMRVGRARKAAEPEYNPAKELLADLAELMTQAAPDTQTARPIVEKLPPNNRLVLCQVGEHHNVRVMVRPNHYNYLIRMEIPMDVSMVNFNPNELLIFNGDPPRRKGQW